MKQKTIITIAVLGVVVGIWGFLYGLSKGLEPEPLTAQIDPTTPHSEPTTETVADNGLRYNQLIQQVAPLSGTSLPVKWGDMGQKLIAAGAIDLDKFKARYGSFSEEQQAILLGNELTTITFKPENIQFWTNVLWSLGLTQDSKVLREGPMKENETRTPLANYASTGGWTLGSKPATELYSSVRLIELTPEQDELVFRVAENIFRPCCGNSTAYPDCNHGMAVLGLLELMASQGATEEELYQAALAFNAYAFSDSYIRVAAYFTMQGISWSEVSPQQVLGPEYSSLQGARRVASAVGPISGMPGQGGSCGA